MPSVQQRIRVVYFGTPAYAVPALESLAGDSRFDVRLVVTQPDRPAGRGRGLQAPAVKLAAETIGLPVHQPETLRSAEARQPLVDVGADVFVVAAYGRIFGTKTLAIPRFGCLNLHASLLPKYRGASPISAAILAGEEATGVTLMRMNAGMDTGDIVAKAVTPINEDDTTGSLTERLATLGARLAVAEIPRWIAGDAIAEPQPAEGASLVRPLMKADGWIDWSKSSGEIERHIRAMQPWPKAWTTTANGSALQIAAVSVAPMTGTQPGQIRVTGKDVFVSAGSGALLLHRVQLSGRSESGAYAMVQGRQLADGDVLGTSGTPDPPPPPLIQPIGSQR